jgi:glycine cleavage system aminomethyltransferase T
MKGSNMKSGFANISDVGKLRISGQSAYDFISTMTSADMLQLEVVGGACAALVLTGQGELIDVVLVIRTGQQEYMLTVAPGLDTEIFEWLSAHAKLKDEDGKLVFAQLELSNESGQVAHIALFGKDADYVFGEISDDPPAAQPKQVHLQMAQLSKLPVLILRYPLLGEEPYYEMFFASAYVENMINLLLSFVELDLLDFDEFANLRAKHKTWFEQGAEAQYTTPKAAGFEHLVRPGGQFVGYKTCTPKEARIL